MSNQVQVKEVKAFNDLLAKAASAADKKSEGITGGILIEAKGNNLQLIATDSDALIRISGEDVTETQEDVSFVAPLMFVDMMKKLPKGDVVLDVHESKVDIKVKKSSYTISTLEVSNFPKKSLDKMDKSFTLNGTKFSEGLKSVQHAMAEVETRPILTGVHLVSNGEYLTMVTTDSHRLFVHKLPLTEEIDEMKNIVIPGGAVKEVIKLLESEEEVKVEYADTLIKFTTDSMTYSTRLLDGNYPDVSKLLPQKFEAEATVHREELIHAIERVKTATGKDKKVVSMEIQEGSMPSMVLQANSTISNVNEELFISEVTKAFNTKMSFVYLQDCLKSLGTKEIKIQNTGQNRPMLIRPVFKDDEASIDQFGLILPVASR